MLLRFERDLLGVDGLGYSRPRLTPLMEKFAEAVAGAGIFPPLLQRQNEGMAETVWGVACSNGQIYIVEIITDDKESTSDHQMSGMETDFRKKFVRRLSLRTFAFF